MNGVLGHDSALSGYTGPGTTWANEMNFGMEHAPGAGSLLDMLTCSPVLYHCAMAAPCDRGRVAGGKSTKKDNDCGA